MRPLILAALLLLTACGADGPPLTPTSTKLPGASLTVTGEVAVGISTQSGP